MKYKDQLNTQQWKAASHTEGPMLVVAGAGSGKTRIVTYRIAHLIELGVPSSEILAVTFTNKAADEMRLRIHKLCQKAILACTFHSLGARILRESISFLGYKNHFAIFDEDDSEKVLKECMREKQIKEEKATIKLLRAEISTAKNTLTDPENPLSCEIYNSYRRKLKACNALDFDDLLFLTVKLFQQEPQVLEQYQNQWNYILIDEYQDTNSAQYNLVHLLSARHRNVFAVGDPDQSIYSWRGANIENILHFEQDYPGAEVIQLEQNYRSTNEILSGANSLIENNESRYEKKLWSERGAGEKIGFCLCDTDRAEVSFVLDRLSSHVRQRVPLNECVIFYRTHFQSRIFEDALLKANIPYTIIGGISFYMRREIKDLLAFLRIAYEGGDFLSFSRTINLPKRGIGPSTQEKIRFASSGDLIGSCSEILKGTLSCKLSQKQQEGLKHYVELIYSLRKLIQEQASISTTIEEVIQRTRYLDFLKEDPETAQDRQENIQELLSKAIEWEEENPEGTLAGFLEEISLKSNLDETQGFDTLRLMTLHNGKGLEFKVTFLVGMEEDLFPHMNAQNDPASIEEERRLCYVGMTRARDFLYLTAARSRHLWGTLRPMQPSRFLSEIPEQYLKKYHKETFSPYIGEVTQDVLEPGAAVFHKDFGKGIVRKAYQSSLGLTYDVYFPESQDVRSLVAKYAKLAKL